MVHSARSFKEKSKRRHHPRHRAPFPHKLRSETNDYWGVHPAASYGTLTTVAPVVHTQIYCIEIHQMDHTYSDFLYKRMKPLKPYVTKDIRESFFFFPKKKRDDSKVKICGTKILMLVPVIRNFFSLTRRRDAHYCIKMKKEFTTLRR